MKKLVVITGCAQGIGAALAKTFLKHDYTVAGLDVAWPAEAETQADFHPFTADVKNEGALLKIAAQIKSDLGSPEIWINNAGIQKLGAFDEISSDDFTKVIAVNFYGVVFGTRAALGVMSEPRRGKIVNVASLSGIVPAPFMSAYVASKHAVVGFTRSLQEEFQLAHSPLQIVLVCPGFVKTSIMKAEAGFRFPDWLNFSVETPEATAQEIFDGLMIGQTEIITTSNGKALKKGFQFFPRLTTRSSRLLVARNWKELFGLSPIRSGIKKP